MKEPLVADSTCLIALERVGKLDLLPELFAPVSIPPAVESEFGRQLDWLEVVELTSLHLADALKMVVGKGESEAIALAVQTKRQLITDDKQARTAADRLGVSVFGTIGLLVRAKNAGILDEIKSILDDLETNRFFVSRALREEVLKIVGE